MSVFSLHDINKSYAGNRHPEGREPRGRAGRVHSRWSGPSGCGKSTLLRIAAGLDHADRGEIVIGGEEVSGKAASDRNIAMVFQSYALYPHLTAGQNIAVPLAMRRLSTAGRLPLIGSHAGGAAPGARRHPAAGPGDGDLSEDRPSARPQAGSDVRRPAPARGARPRHGAPSQTCS